MAKKAKRKRTPQRITRKQTSRLKRETRLEKGLIASAVAVAVVVVGVLAYGLIFEKVVKAREAVAVVGDEPVRTVDFQARVRFIRVQMQLELENWQNERVSIDPTDDGSEFYLNYIDTQVRGLEDSLSEENVLVIGEQALDQLVLYELVRQEAERRDFAVSEQEVQKKIELDLGYDRDAATSPLTATDVLSPSAPLPTPMTRESFLQQFDFVLNNLLEPLSISESQYRSWVAADLLVQELRQRMAEEQPAESDQVKMRLLSADDESEAMELVARLEAGEDPQALADALEADEESTATITELEWFPRSTVEGALGAELAALAFSLDVGARSQPVLGIDGSRYYSIEILGHEVQELDEAVRQRMAEEAFQEWVAAQQFLVERRSYLDRVPQDP